MVTMSQITLLLFFVLESANAKKNSSSPPPPVPPPEKIAQTLNRLPTSPSIQEIQQAALRRATVSPKVTRRWLHRARAAAALPSVRGELDVKLDQGWQLDQEAGLADEVSQDLGAGRIFRVRAAWDLDRLIFDTNELRAVQAGLDVASFRERLLVQVTQLYFERQQLLVEIELLPAKDGYEAIARHVRRAEVEAILEGLTGLQFTPVSYQTSFAPSLSEGPSRPNPQADVQDVQNQNPSFPIPMNGELGQLQSSKLEP